MAVHNACFDENRFTIPEQYPVALQPFPAPADWGAFVQEMNGYGTRHDIHDREADRSFSMGYWNCCLCLCCICGPCIHSWKASKLVEELRERQAQSLQMFEDDVKRSCLVWQERCGNQIGFTMIRGGDIPAKRYKFWIAITPVMMTQQPMLQQTMVPPPMLQPVMTQPPMSQPPLAQPPAVQQPTVVAEPTPIARGQAWAPPSGDANATNS